MSEYTLEKRRSNIGERIAQQEALLNDEYLYQEEAFFEKGDIDSADSEIISEREKYLKYLRGEQDRLSQEEVKHHRK